MRLDELFDLDLFRQMQEEKMVTIRPHDGYDLYIANYGDAAQFKNCWNDVTLNCRGLIYEALSGRILARPWKKFFNLGDAKAPYIGFGDRVEVTDKMDGSLGILYVYNDEPSIATRGSFHSTQAGWATKQIRRVSDLELSMAEHYTFLFEVIYPENRIVVDYGKFEGLVLLGAVEISTGFCYGPNESAALLNWRGLTTEVMPFKSINEILAAPHRKNAEGMVIRAGNKLVKYKYPEYVELHRLISNLSEKSVWSGLEGGRTVEELIEGLPDEFHGFVRETSGRLLKAHDDRMAELEYKNLLVARRQYPDRKSLALAIKDDPEKKYLFALADGKDIAPLIWQELKPKGDDDGRSAISN